MGSFITYEGPASECDDKELSIEQKLEELEKRIMDKTTKLIEQKLEELEKRIMDKTFKMIHSLIEGHDHVLMTGRASLVGGPYSQMTLMDLLCRIDHRKPRINHLA